MARAGICTSRLVAFAGLFLPVLPVLPANAQGWIEPRHPRPDVQASPVVRTGSQVRISVDGRIARVEVEEQFRNTGGGLAEGSYLYPMPGEAVFTSF